MIKTAKSVEQLFVQTNKAYDILVFGCSCNYNKCHGN